MKLLNILFLFFLSGCALFVDTKMKYSETAGAKTYPARAENCSVKILSEEPDSKYQTLGQLEFSSGKFNGRLVAGLSKGQVEKMAHPVVCEKGGNALLLGAPSAIGNFSKAKVIRLEKP